MLGISPVINDSTQKNTIACSNFGTSWKILYQYNALEKAEPKTASPIFYSDWHA
jgi:hypothetical protein